MGRVYLLFNEGYAASGGEANVRAPLCDEAIRLTRLLQRLFPVAPEVMGLAALLLLQHARTPARLDAAGGIVLVVGDRSEEHTSELQSLMRISYAVFCLKKTKKKQHSVNHYRNAHTTHFKTFLSHNH